MSLSRRDSDAGCPHSQLACPGDHWFLASPLHAIPAQPRALTVPHADDRMLTTSAWGRNESEEAPIWP